MNTVKRKARLASLWANARPSDSWTDIVTKALEALGGTAELKALYAVIESHPRARLRKHWQAKIRQRIQADEKTFVRLRPGVWSFAKRYSPQKVAKLRRLRRELYPVKPKRQRKG